VIYGIHGSRRTVHGSRSRVVPQGAGFMGVFARAAQVPRPPSIPENRKISALRRPRSAGVAGGKTPCQTMTMIGRNRGRFLAVQSVGVASTLPSITPAGSNALAAGRSSGAT
jgi:hypothetical protein